jgi:hypothetical protein
MAGGFLDFVFGGFRRPPPPPPPQQVNSPTEFFQSLFSEPRHSESVRSSGGGGSGAYCVRMCDGRYFPLQSRRGASAAEQCHAVCPATETKVFSGGSDIDRAVASDGTHYSEIPNAFVYRKQFVSSCTCNGKTNYSLAHVPIANDPTLRPGDVVATNSGFTVYNGRDPGQQQAFTPIASANVSKGLRAELADTKVTPRALPEAASTTGLAPDTTSSIAADRRHLSARER